MRTPEASPNVAMLQRLMVRQMEEFRRHTQSWHGRMGHQRQHGGQGSERPADAPIPRAGGAIGGSGDGALDLDLFEVDTFLAALTQMGFGGANGAYTSWRPGGEATTSAPSGGVPTRGRRHRHRQQQQPAAPVAAVAAAGADAETTGQQPAAGGTTARGASTIATSAAFATASTSGVPPRSGLQPQPQPQPTQLGANGSVTLNQTAVAATNFAGSGQTNVVQAPNTRGVGARGESGAQPTAQSQSHDGRVHQAAPHLHGPPQQVPSQPWLPPPQLPQQQQQPTVMVPQPMGMSSHAHVSTLPPHQSQMQQQLPDQQQQLQPTILQSPPQPLPYQLYQPYQTWVQSAPVIGYGGGCGPQPCSAQGQGPMSWTFPATAAGDHTAVGPQPLLPPAPVAAVGIPQPNWSLSSGSIMHTSHGSMVFYPFPPSPGYTHTGGAQNNQ
ncbi:hypothetical protein Vretimale_10945 [Volvox reticuliferus]|nr:hypothetical protein Vretimale_10945 [Volvox reticuliferus]